jgi:hypothetical protein
MKHNDNEKTFPQADPHCQSWRTGIDREIKEEKMRKKNFGKYVTKNNTIL